MGGTMEKGKINGLVGEIHRPAKEKQPWKIRIIDENTGTYTDAKTWANTTMEQITEWIEGNKIYIEADIKRFDEYNGVKYPIIDNILVVKKEPKPVDDTYSRIAEKSFAKTIELINKYKQQLESLGIDKTEVFRVVYGTMTIQANKEVMVKKIRRE